MSWVARAHTTRWRDFSWEQAQGEHDEVAGLMRRRAWLASQFIVRPSRKNIPHVLLRLRSFSWTPVSYLCPALVEMEGRGGGGGGKAGEE
jgi:hypothetical protein